MSPHLPQPLLCSVFSEQPSSWVGSGLSLWFSLETGVAFSLQFQQLVDYVVEGSVTPVSRQISGALQGFCPMTVTTT